MKIFLTVLIMVIAALPASASSNLVRNVYTDNMYSGIEGADLTKKNIMKGKESAKEKRMLEKARDLESVMISVMVDPMFPKGKESGLYGGGQGNDVYRMLMIQEYGKILSKSNSLGVADNIAKQLNKKEK